VPTRSGWVSRIGALAGITLKTSSLKKIKYFLIKLQKYRHKYRQINLSGHIPQVRVL
jgi:hypothetical protein